MNFERNQSPKEVMGVGLESSSITISKVTGDIQLHWSKNKKRLDESYSLKKRWWVPLRWVLPLLNMEEVPIEKLRLLFRASGDFSDILEKFWPGTFPWFFIRKRNRRIKKNKPYVKVDIGGYWQVKKYSDNNENTAYLNFSIISEDLEKMEKIKESRDNDKGGLKGVIYKGQIYEIKMGNKKLL